MAHQKLYPFKNTYLYFKLAGKIGAGPFTWKVNHKNPFNNPLALETSKSGFFLYHFYNLYEPIYAIFLWITLYQHYPSFIDQGQTTELFIHIVFSVCTTSGILTKIHQMLYWKEMLHPINQMIKFAGELLCKWVIHYFILFKKY